VIGVFADDQAGSENNNNNNQEKRGQREQREQEGKHSWKVKVSAEKPATIGANFGGSSWGFESLSSIALET
jgi:hypothetical protein